MIAVANLPLILNGGLSYDNTKIVEYIWNFGDGNILSTIETTVEHVYRVSGKYRVCLTVIDIMGNNDTAVIFINVINNASVYPKTSEIIFLVATLCEIEGTLSYIILRERYKKKTNKINNKIKIKINT